MKNTVNPQIRKSTVVPAVRNNKLLTPGSTLSSSPSSSSDSKVSSRRPSVIHFCIGKNNLKTNSIKDIQDILKNQLSTINEAEDEDDEPQVKEVDTSARSGLRHPHVSSNSTPKNIHNKRKQKMSKIISSCTCNGVDTIDNSIHPIPNNNKKSEQHRQYHRQPFRVTDTYVRLVVRLTSGGRTKYG